MEWWKGYKMIIPLFVTAHVNNVLLTPLNPNILIRTVLLSLLQVSNFLILDADPKIFVSWMGTDSNN
jgi:hypothetical protein